MCILKHTRTNKNVHYYEHDFAPHLLQKHTQTQRNRGNWLQLKGCGEKGHLTFDDQACFLGQNHSYSFLCHFRTPWATATCLEANESSLKGDFFIILLSPPFSNTIISVIKAGKKEKKLWTGNYCRQNSLPMPLMLHCFKQTKLSIQLNIIVHTCYTTLIIAENAIKDSLGKIYPSDW